MDINKIKSPEMHGNTELRFGKMFNEISVIGSSGIEEGMALSSLGTTFSNGISNLTTTGVPVIGKNLVMEMPANRLLTFNQESTHRSHSLEVALPYGRSDSENCLRQFFDRAERRFNK